MQYGEYGQAQNYPQQTAASEVVSLNHRMIELSQRLSEAQATAQNIHGLLFNPRPSPVEAGGKDAPDATAEAHISRMERTASALIDVLVEIRNRL